MDRTEFVELMLEEVELVDLSVFKAVFESFKVQWYHNKLTFYSVYMSLISVLEEVEVPDELVFVLHSLVKDIFPSPLSKVRYMKDDEYKQRMIWLYRSVRSLEVKLVDTYNDDFETIKMILKSDEKN
jgi:hypothetical protein